MWSFWSGPRILSADTTGRIKTVHSRYDGSDLHSQATLEAKPRPRTPMSTTRHLHHVKTAHCHRGRECFAPFTTSVNDYAPVTGVNAQNLLHGYEHRHTVTIYTTSLHDNGQGCVPHRCEHPDDTSTWWLPHIREYRMPSSCTVRGVNAHSRVLTLRNIPLDSCGRLPVACCPVRRRAETFVT